MVKVVKMKQQISILKTKADVAEMKTNQAEVFVSWQLSNSSIKVFCARYARIVDNPLRVAFKWVNTGARAEIYKTTKYN